MSDTLSLQLSVTTLVAYAQQLPADYHISIRLLRHGYTIEVIDPDGTSLVEVATPRLFGELVEIAQMDALRRATDGTHRFPSRAANSEAAPLLLVCGADPGRLFRLAGHCRRQSGAIIASLARRMPRGSGTNEQIRP